MTARRRTTARQRADAKHDAKRRGRQVLLRLSEAEAEIVDAMRQPGETRAAAIRRVIGERGLDAAISRSARLARAARLIAIAAGDLAASGTALTESEACMTLARQLAAIRDRRIS